MQTANQKNEDIRATWLDEVTSIYPSIGSVFLSPQRTQSTRKKDRPRMDTDRTDRNDRDSHGSYGSDQGFVVFLRVLCVLCGEKNSAFSHCGLLLGGVPL